MLYQDSHESLQLISSLKYQALMMFANSSYDVASLKLVEPVLFLNVLVSLFICFFRIRQWFEILSAYVDDLG